MTRRNLIATIAAAAVAPVAPTWAAEKFGIVSYPSGTERLVEGLTFGCWGVREWEPGTWNITHLPTGLQLPCGFGGEWEVRRFVERLAATGDYSAVTHPATDALGRKLKAEFDALRYEAVG